VSVAWKACEEQSKRIHNSFNTIIHINGWKEIEKYSWEYKGN
jgi:hypothetical protein